MKISVTHTYELSKKEVKALKEYWEEMRDEGETFRDFVRQYHTSAGTHYVYDKITEYMEV
jgi:sulfite reductase beta subunit-like hemoprotein